MSLISVMLHLSALVFLSVGPLWRDDVNFEKGYGKLADAAPAREPLNAGNFVDTAPRGSFPCSEIQGATVGPGRHVSLIVKISMYI